jgi:hypothetical protein
MTDLRELAWNGIRFEAPSTWEIGQLDSRRLLLEDDSSPTLEIKWGPVKGRFSHRSHFQRLVALHTKRLKKNVQPWSLPAEWENALAGFQTSGFRWQTETAGGRGAILFCPVCRNATLIQFFRPKSAPTGSMSSSVLTTFRDHREDGHIAWCVFDIRALLPDNFKLVRHRFAAGRYDLEFAAGGLRLHLHRWAPASVWLGSEDLLQFAKKNTDFQDENAASTIINGCRGIEGNILPRFKWLGRLRRFAPKPAFQWWRLWHLGEKNRILGIHLQGQRARDSLMLNRIVGGYDSL